MFGPIPSPNGKHVAYTAGVMEANIMLFEKF
jgi:hypothetical protein